MRLFNVFIYISGRDNSQADAAEQQRAQRKKLQDDLKELNQVGDSARSLFVC